MTAFIPVLAIGVVVEAFLPGGSRSSETIEISEKNGVSVFRLPKGAIVARKAEKIRITPAFARAEKGEEGFWFSPYGYYGEFDRDNGEFVANGERMNMPMYGWRTPRGAYLAIITSLKCYPREVVTVRDGAYAISCQLDGSLVKRPYEDLEIEFHRLPATAGYSELARVYRDYQLKRGAVKPLSERVRDNPALRYAVEAPEIRIRQAWKPVPSPVAHQSPENEPPVHVAITFDRVQDIVRELKAQGVGKAELCLVGWNIGGHDGRWPQAFPSEPLLGGDAKLKELIAVTQKAGYQIVPHGNFIDSYTIAENWDAEMLAKGEDGLPHPDRGGKYRWGGGVPYRICPQRAYEKICLKDVPRMAAFGFRGLGYFDVVSILCASECLDPRHPCSFADGARYWGLCAELIQREMGGFASEGAVDHFAGSLDSVLYSSFDAPETIRARWKDNGALAKDHVPIFQLVYNGIIVQNPFTFTVNFTRQERYAQLKLVEYGGRPNFYFYSKFVSDGSDWMGKYDLGCKTDAELKESVAAIKRGWDAWKDLSRLQYLFMEKHERIDRDVFATTWSDGTKIYVNYGSSPADVGGVRIPAQEWIVTR